MKTYTIKDIPDEQYRQLRILAAQNEQSINKHLLHLIKKATEGDMVTCARCEQKTINIRYDQMTNEPLCIDCFEAEDSIRKFWKGPDGEEIGAWPANWPDEDIIDELLDQCTSDKQRENIRKGEIITGEWSE